MAEKICPHNSAVDCENPVCKRCGWNPAVDKERRRSLFGDQKMYRITFTGYCEVFARNPEEALDAADNDDMFFVHYEFGDPECLDKEEEDELD